jgi:hypothetical protein
MKRFLSVLLLTAIIGGAGTVATAQSAPSPAPSAAVVQPTVAPASAPIIVDPSVAAVDKAVPNQDANTLISQFFTLLATGKVGAAISCLILLLTYLFKVQFVDKGKIGSGSLPWLAIALGVICGVASNVMLGASPLAAAEAILFSGPMASTAWSAILKLVLKKA